MDNETGVSQKAKHSFPLVSLRVPLVSPWFPVPFPFQHPRTTAQTAVDRNFPKTTSVKNYFHVFVFIYFCDAHSVTTASYCLQPGGCHSRVEFPRGFPWFPLCFPRGFPFVFPWCPLRFPVVSPSFPRGFPLVSPGFSWTPLCLPVVSLVSLSFPFSFCIWFPTGTRLARCCGCRANHPALAPRF